MIDIKDNTVPATDQTINSSDLLVLGKDSAKIKILIVGNSITRHGPKEQIGWSFDHGMAASVPEKDYVHLLYNMITSAGYEVCMRVRQGATWELRFSEPNAVENEFALDRAFNADVVLFRLGENIPVKMQKGTKVALEKFIDYICPPNKKTVFTTCFWENPVVDDAIRQVAKERGEQCVEIGCESDEQMALGQFWHKGVAMHPNDNGMQMIADRVFKAIIREFDNK